MKLTPRTEHYLKLFTDDDYRMNYYYQHTYEIPSEFAQEIIDETN